LADLARTLQDEKDLENTLAAIVRTAAETVPGAQEASISSVAHRREVHTIAATGELPRAVDQAQYDTGQGPCLETLYEQQTVRLPDLTTEQRWPDFSARTTELGLGSMLSVQLYVHGSDLGALNLFSRERDAFDDESEQVALLFASHAAVALVGAQEQEQLHTALNSRDVIGQAKGILMERYKITDHDAFRLLIVASQTTNIKLAEVAKRLAQTGTLASHKP
jgi:GAF domain-containing protein